MLQDSNGFTALDIALSAENTICSKLLKDASGNFIIFVLLDILYYIVLYYKLLKNFLMNTIVDDDLLLSVISIV